jgi:hypothetical protein
MDGVAHTSGTHTEKWIEFSLHYIERVADRVQDEVVGVLVHEVVHCYQFNGNGTCPGGLIEGIAGSCLLFQAPPPKKKKQTGDDTRSLDYVRLRSGFAPPHWSKSPGDKWDSGYQNTAYFLAWIEERHGDGTVQKLNFCLKEMEYHKSIFVQLTGESVEKLWKTYCEQLRPAGKLATVGRKLLCSLI